MTENEKIITLNGTEYIIKTDNGQSLTSELLTNVKNQLMIKMGITSNPESNSTIMKLGTPTCPTSPIPLNTVGTLTASVTQGTAPFTYIWTITRPTGVTDTLPNSAGPHSYTFALTGTYGINLTVVDSCPSGGLSDTSFCSVIISPSTGSISFSTSPSGANIYIDGTLVGITPATISNVTAGSHSYTLTLSGYNNATGTVTVTAGQTATVSVTLTPVVTTGSIAFTSSPSGANIYLDGTLVGVTPATITNVSAGSHSYTLTLSGYNDYTGTVTVTAGQTSTISATLTALPTTGSITFTSTPSAANIYIDNILQTPKTPATITNVPAGSHTYIIRLSGYNDATGSVSVIAGQTATVTATLTPTPSYSNWVMSKGGTTGLTGNLSALGEIIDGYLGMINLGFTVTLGNVGTTINYYLGV